MLLPVLGALLSPPQPPPDSPGQPSSLNCAADQVNYKCSGGPVFTREPPNIISPAYGPTGGPATFATPTASTAGLRNPPTVVCVPSSGSNFPLGNTTVV